MEQGVETGMQSIPAMADMAALVRRVREFADQHRDICTVHDAIPDAETMCRDFGYTPRGQGRAEVILAQDCAAELGHPSTASHAILLCTPLPGLVHSGRVIVAGPDIGAMKPGAPAAFAQVVMLHVDPQRQPDPFDLDNAQYLMRRLPGWSVRTVPGKLWVRVGGKAAQAGLDLRVAGAALIQTYEVEFPGVLGAEVLFVTSSARDVEALRPVAVEASILAGRHKKLVIGESGNVECTELNCETCDEKVVCDNLRDIVIARRKRV